MILSSAVFGGESPNDRMDTLLSLMTGVSERVDKLVKNVGKIETKVNNIEDEMVEVKSDVASTNSKVSTIESDVAVVKNSVGWKFVGMGDAVTYDDNYNPGSGHSLAKCLGVCTNKRSSDSTWNGVLFYPSGGYCWCYKNDVGHNPSDYKDMLHFKFE